MNILALILPLAYSLSSFHPKTCYQYLCGSNKISDTTTPCISVNKNNRSVTVLTCDSSNNLICDPFPYYEFSESTWSNTTCRLNTVENGCDALGTVEPGLQCCTNKNCISSDCFDGKCRGKAIAGYCESSKECAAGLYCDTRQVCSNTKPGGSNCTQDIECTAGYGCNRGNCTQIFSLDVGASVNDAKFCKSNFMSNEICEILTPRIRDVEGILFPPFMCLQNQICDLYYSNGTHYRDYECICAGYYDLSEGFCGYDLVHVKGVMDQVYVNLQYSESECSGDKAHSSDPEILLKCNSIDKDQYNLYFNLFNQYSFYNIYVTGSLDACAKDYGLWDYQYTIRDYLSISSALFISLGLINLLIS